MFRSWLKRKPLGIVPVGLDDFLSNDNDAIATIEAKNVNAIKIAILDGVLFIKGNNKMYKSITETYKDYNIMSSLVLREFLYQL